jgi:hypothetical protein
MKMERITLSAPDTVLQRKVGQLSPMTTKRSLSPGDTGVGTDGLSTLESEPEVLEVCTVLEHRVRRTTAAGQIFLIIHSSERETRRGNGYRSHYSQKPY